MFFESNYVYNLKIVFTYRVVDKNEINPIVYFSVNSATCFGLTDQRQADQ